MLKAFNAQQVRGQSGITAVVNALAKAGIELGENGAVIANVTAALRWRIFPRWFHCKCDCCAALADLSLQM